MAVGGALNRNSLQTLGQQSIQERQPFVVGTTSLLEDGRQRETGDEGHCAGALACCPPRTSSRGNGPEFITAGWIQLGKPEKIRSPADLHRPQQLLLGDQIRWNSV